MGKLRVGTNYYKSVGLVAVSVYLPKSARTAYQREAAKLRKRGKKVSAQRLMAAVLLKYAPKKSKD